MAYPFPTEIHRVVDPEGNLVGDPPELSPEQHRKLYYWMVFGRMWSERMVALQRQGRMGTFAPHVGQEAQAGIASPLRQDDWLLGTYRECIAYFVKGLSPLAPMATHRGYFSRGYTRELGLVPLQIVIGNQMLHAVGVAMAMQYEGTDRVAVGVCGDGATSQGDFHEALNFAAVFQAPFIAVVQNNQYAISVPRQRQAAVEYLAYRGPAFGIPGYIVDGNDVLAVHKVVQECVERARAGEGPSLVELLTYRMGAHTTADDPTKYRSDEEVAHWQARDPIKRYRIFLLRQEILSNEEDEALHEQATADLQRCVEEFEAMPPPRPEEIFEHVFETPPPNLLRQRDEILGTP